MTDSWPKVTDAKALAQKLGGDGIIVLKIKDGRVGGASYGKDRRHCALYGKLLDTLILDYITLEDVTLEDVTPK